MRPLIPLYWTSGDVCPGFQSQGGFPHRFAEEALNLLMIRFAEEALNLLMIRFAEEAVARGSDESRRRVLDRGSAQPISDREDVGPAVVLVVRCSRESISISVHTEQKRTRKREISKSK